MPGGLIDKLRWRMERASRRRRFTASLRHLHGPERAETPIDAVIVIALVRNGIYYLETFLRHYRALGAAQFVFCDNGSTDGTIARLSAEADCVVLQSLSPWGEIENDFRRHAAERYAPGRWCLFADMDEIFVWDEGLPPLARRLEAQGATALVAQMLEMVPQGPIRAAARLSYDEALMAFDHYDLRDVRRHYYHDPAIGFAWYLAQNRVASDRVKVMFGGLRARLFGENCCLTKHPFVHVLDGIAPGVHPHVSAHVTVADFTALIRHYKFAGDSAARDADTVARGVSAHGEDRARLARMTREPELSLCPAGAARFEGLGPLYDAGFLIAPEGEAA